MKYKYVVDVEFKLTLYKNETPHTLHKTFIVETNKPDLLENQKEFYEKLSQYSKKLLSQYIRHVQYKVIQIIEPEFLILN